MNERRFEQPQNFSPETKSRLPNLENRETMEEKPFAGQEYSLMQRFLYGTERFIKSKAKIMILSSALISGGAGLGVGGKMFYEHLVEKEATKLEDLIEKDPERAAEKLLGIYYGESAAFSPNMQKYLPKLLERTPATFLKYSYSFAEQPGGQELVMKVAKEALENHPDWLIYNFDHFLATKKIGRDLEETSVEALKRSPSCWFGLQAQYDQAQSVFVDTFKVFLNSKDPAIRTIVEIGKHYFPGIPMSQFSRRKAREKIAPFLDEIVRGEITIDQASAIANDSKESFDHLIKIKSKSDHLARFDVDKALETACLRYMREVNDRHNLPDSERFGAVKDAGPKELYWMIVYGEEEIFTSSFQGFFSRMMKRMSEKNLSGDQFLENVGYDKFRVFIKLCINYGSFRQFLDTMPQKAQKELLAKFIGGIGEAKDPLFEAATAAEVLSTVDDPEILDTLKTNLRDEHEKMQKARDTKSTKIIGFLSGLIGARSLEKEEWFKGMVETYKIKEMTGLSADKLFNKDGVNIQCHYFYNDYTGDGITSYRSFLHEYLGRPGVEKEWRLENKGPYIIIRSVTGNKVEIYANKPEQGEEGIKEH